MKKINRKRLNNKGFTLVELLAVVVILALVMGIAATSMLSTMNSSRKSTLHSAAQTAATNLNNWIADDMLATTANDQKLGNDFVKNTQTVITDETTGTVVTTYGKDRWICLENTVIKEVSNKGSKAELLDVLGLSKDDLVINGSGTAPVKPAGGKYTITENAASGNTCSALRYNSSTGGYEFLLIAKNGGKYYVASDTAHYAFSRASDANELIAD